MTSRRQQRPDGRRPELSIAGVLHSNRQSTLLKWCEELSQGNPQRAGDPRERLEAETALAAFHVAYVVAVQT